MSSPPEPASNPKPVVKDKNPHNYRKVGYSMIVISVSLVAIGLLVWAIGDDYHFSTNIMAAQEVDAMTPKSGYNIVLFDASQPVGAKLKLLDESGSLDEARVLQTQDAKQNVGTTLQVLVFNGSASYNTQLMADAEVYLQTPKTGYNVVLFSYPLPVGQKLALGIHEDLLANATDYQKTQEDNLKGQEIKVLIFTPNFRDDLKMITGSSTPVGDYANVTNSVVNQTAPQEAVNQTVSATGNQTITASTTVNNNTNATLANFTGSNKTSIAVTNQPSNTNVTKAVTQNTLPKTNMTMAASNHTGVQKANQTNSENATLNATATTKVSKSVIISEKIGINATGK